MLNVSTYSRKDLTEEFRNGEQITEIEYDIEGYDHASPGKKCIYKRIDEKYIVGRVQKSIG